MGLLGWFLGSGPSGFGYSSTAEQVTDGVDASHLTAIVTGASSGIGKETARVLALRGATVIIPARTLEAAAKAKESLLEGNPDAKIEVMELDLGSLASVESFARAFLSSGRPLNLLQQRRHLVDSVPAVHRWSRVAVRHQSPRYGQLTSHDPWKPVGSSAALCGLLGFTLFWVIPTALISGVHESGFIWENAGPFFLTKLLLDKMKATARETGTQGRIINVSSSDHAKADGSWLDLDTINDQSKYRGLQAYGRSKLANILHADELSRRFLVGKTNLSTLPGYI
ncbi:hypothetical protein Taro_017297 [Colocasia esculenta]|uniref:Uncharacterized protein n=1 Tax=Colocasia esculenta TaxID=4460 RepID=A0A843UR01_COLES|nr:hypothetical protein [Colocasia esculenta]